jgi:hypothetical protein
MNVQIRQTLLILKLQSAQWLKAPSTVCVTSSDATRLKPATHFQKAISPDRKHHQIATRMNNPVLKHLLESVGEK